MGDIPPEKPLRSGNQLKAPRYWIGVASRDHVRLGVRGGFLQLGHGKLAPVKRLSKGDYIIYYSPRATFPDGEPLRAFTALGKVLDDEPMQCEQTESFHPHRRRVRYSKVRETPIAPLLSQLEITKKLKNWGMIFRRSSFEVSEGDFEILRATMRP